MNLFINIYHLLVAFGIISGDRQAFTARRKPSGFTVCACCARRAAYWGRSYGDLVRISREIEIRERRIWKESSYISSIAREEEAFCGMWDEEALQDSAAIRSFNREEERMLCPMCVQTVFMALEDGELLAGSEPEDVSLLPPEAASAAFFSSMKKFTEGIRHRDRCSRTFAAGSREESCSVYLHQASGQRGMVHSFACCMQDLPGDYRAFDAYEIHRLTKAEKIAREYTGTDNDFRTGLKERCPEDNEEDRRRIYTGFLELASKNQGCLYKPSPRVEQNGSYGTEHYFLRITALRPPLYRGDEDRKCGRRRRPDPGKAVERGRVWIYDRRPYLYRRGSISHVQSILKAGACSTALRIPQTVLLERENTLCRSGSVRGAWWRRCRNL